MTNYIRAYYYLQCLMRRVYWDRNKLRAYQNRKIRDIVKYAYANSPFYNRKFRESGVRPESVRSIEDLSKLPIIRKDDLRNNLNEVASSEFSIASLSVQRTSGSTGRPLHFYLTGAENEFRKAKHLRANMILGQKPFDRWVTITSPLHFAETTRLQRAIGFFAVSPISVFDDLDTQILKIEALKPDVLDGYSNSILLLAKEVEKRGLTTIRPKFLVGGAELIAGSSRRFVEQVFGVPFYDQYACVEFERVAWQCPARNGYHIDADSVVVQFVDESGQEVAQGEDGEIVCTSLFNYAMPFVRYAVGDMGVPSGEVECSCGRTFPLMKVVEGRKDSLLILPRGRILAPFAFIATMMTFKFYSNIDLFRVIQKRVDHMVLKLKMHTCPVDLGTVEKELLAHFRKVLDIPTGDVVLEVEFVDDIPLDKSGKFKIVVSEL